MTEALVTSPSQLMPSASDNNELSLNRIMTYGPCCSDN